MMLQKPAYLNECPRCIFFKPANWSQQKLDFQNEFSISKIIRIFLTFLIKSGPIFDKAAKLGKASWDAYNWRGWLIF